MLQPLLMILSPLQWISLLGHSNKRYCLKLCGKTLFIMESIAAECFLFPFFLY